MKIAGKIVSGTWWVGAIAWVVIVLPFFIIWTMAVLKDIKVEADAIVDKEIEFKFEQDIQRQLIETLQYNDRARVKEIDQLNRSLKAKAAPPN